MWKGLLPLSWHVGGHSWLLRPALGPQYKKDIGKPGRALWRATRLVMEEVQGEVEGAAFVPLGTEEVKDELLSLPVQKSL